ncbi:MAG: hypothetical protein HY760_00495 [Nitrospirae bacterium]|nr:hypothetical protein [Nitrospirota bacterium]
MIDGNPFLKIGYGGRAMGPVTVEDRLNMMKKFDVTQCRAALKLPYIQKTVRKALVRRLRQLGGEVMGAMRPTVEFWPDNEAGDEDVDETTCSRCGCCSDVYEDCWKCGGEGLCGHDCGEDTCCCLDPDEDNVTCDACFGGGYHIVCAGNCDENGKHSPRQG